MKILGIDPGIIQTGFGIINVNDNVSKLIDYGIIKPSAKDSLADRLFTIFHDVCKIISDYKPQIFAIEDIFYGKNVKSAMRLGQARGAAMVAAAFNEVPIYEIISGAAIAFAAFLLILPGFATDFLGFLLIFPFTRKLIIGKFTKKTKTKTKKDFIEGQYEDIDEDLK